MTTFDVAPPEDRELWQRTRRVMEDAFTRLQQLVAESVKFEEYSSFPKFDADDASTFRRVSTGSGPLRYESAFSVEERWGSHVLYDELDGFRELLDYVRSIPALVDFLAPTRLREDLGERMLVFHVADFALEIVERHIHTAGLEPHDGALLDLYSQKERWWLHHDALPADLLVPIIGLSFHDEQIDLAGGLRIERMAPGTQLARWPGNDRALHHENALRASTHVLVLPGQILAGEEAFAWLNAIDEYPAEAVDEFFETLAVESPHHGGYVQLLYRPIGWADHFRADLPPLVQGPIVPRYPRRFARPIAEPLDVLDGQRGESLKARFSALREAQPLVRLASQRLVAASRRDEDVDRILDLCIGIEALVSDSSPGDTTFKMALRTATLLAHSVRPAVTYQALRKVYSYRSAVVHGQAKAARKRLINVAGNDFAADRVAEFFLRELLKEFLRDAPLSPEAIDDRILQILDARGDDDAVSPDTTRAQKESPNATVPETS